MSGTDSSHGNSNARRRTRRRSLALVILGLATVAFAALWAGIVIARVDDILVRVRPATPAEAPSPAHGSSTVVAEPDGSPSVLPKVKGILMRLVGLGLLAALGAGVAAWGATALPSASRDTPGQADIPNHDQR